MASSAACFSFDASSRTEASPLDKSSLSRSLVWRSWPSVATGLWNTNGSLEARTLNGGEDSGDEEASSKSEEQPGTLRTFSRAGYFNT